MALGPWLQLFDAVGGLVDVSRRWRAGSRTPRTDALSSSSTAGIGQLEARLAGVVVAALREAFDRDRARLDLERTALEAERERAQQAFGAELLRQEADRLIFQMRLIAAMSLIAWITSAVFIPWLPGIRHGMPRILLGSGWAALIATIAAALAAHATLIRELAAMRATPVSGPLLRRAWIEPLAAILLIVGLTLTAASLLASL
ncbi:MAG: hypothetical protein HYX76_06215 [Acidobacteria bacterium]|nr:hypothetical protein [Acidobacteriota bacterium]